MGYLLIRCDDTGKQGGTGKKAEEETSRYAGSEACASCHTDIYNTHINTAHFHTSAVATETNVLGRFSTDSNTYDFGNSNLVKAEKRAAGLYQVAYINGTEKKRQQLNVVFGFGKVAQSFGSWSGSKLVQLPLSYFVPEQHWVNSPGYPDKILFNRVITSRCMECHSSFVRVTGASGPFEDMDQGSVIYGIGCEKCHGPASAHIAFEKEHPGWPDPDRIINPKRFSRQQLLDLCGLCHSGAMNNIQPAFSFKPGDRLADFYAYNIVAQSADDLDVHGNQYGMLSLSNCFIKSEMTCSSCHSSHRNEEKQINIFSQRCMHCHQEGTSEFCKFNGATAAFLKKNCIDCHMPLKASRAIVFLEQKTKEKVGAVMRSHLIKVYPEESRKVIRFLKKSPEKMKQNLGG